MYSKKELLKQLLLNQALKFNTGIKKDSKPCHWILDCRELCLSPPGSYLVTELLYEMLQKYQCTQIGGVTLGADPLVGAMVLYSFQVNNPISGFIIRKSAKSHGLQKVIEGDFTPQTSVVLVDDIVNSGRNIFYALDLLESIGCKVSAVISIVNFKRRGFRQLQHKGITVDYLFDLSDLWIENSYKVAERVEAVARWRLTDINRWPVTIPRSTPVIQNNHLLFGTNEGKFLSVHKKTGVVRWQADLELNNKKGILSSPCVDSENVYFGAYDGYLYCMNADDGRQIWKTRNGQWIGSSPCMDQDKVYIGIEYNENGGSPAVHPQLKNKRLYIGPNQQKEKGALCAYSKKDGGLRWILRTGHYIHSSPCIDKKRKRIMVGCNDGWVYAADTETGNLCWTFKTGGPIRAGFIVDGDTGFVYFGSDSGIFYCLDVLSGHLIWSKKIGSRIYNTPELNQNWVIISTVSKRVFALNKTNGLVQWFYNTGNFIFSSTRTQDRKVYCGDNDGYLHVIDLHSGRLIGQYDVGNEILTRPIIENNQAYLGCKGTFVCLDLNSR